MAKTDSSGSAMSDNRSLFTVVMTLASAAVAYLVGGYTAQRNLGPWHLMRQIQHHYDPPQLFTFDKIGRLIAKVGSELVACPHQDDRTAVILILGQSNAGNHGGQKTKSEYGSRIVNFFDGQCYIAASP